MPISPQIVITPSDITTKIFDITNIVNNGTSVTYTAVGHTLTTGDIVIISDVNPDDFNGLYTITSTATDTFTITATILADPVTLTTVKASGSTNPPVGSVTVVAQPDFGSQAYVNADAVLNGSTETATSTTYNYSAVDIVPFYTSDVAPNPSMRTAPCRVWIPDAGATTTVSSDGQRLLSDLTAYIV